MGGKDNIVALEHCATRLRIVVKDNDLVAADVIKNIDKVRGYFYQSGQHQIILGTGLVDKIYALMTADAPVSSASVKQSAYENMNWFQKSIRALADVFIPLIPVLVATGLFIGIRGFAKQLGFEFSPDVLVLTQVVTDT
ncbi:PTS transporter subunit EIIB, partial [Pseudomonas marginalis]|uniref:PTS transporter subunit EIIB n=1 Tax=Pseudomonas marginalis TaxID=298 RepID=UPI002B1E6966